MPAMDMDMRFIGRYNTVPYEHNPDIKVFEEDFGLLLPNGWLLIAPEGAHTDGASIPRLAWPLCGHPLQSPNHLWATHHDVGYSGAIIFIDTNRVLGDPEDIFDEWRGLNPASGCFVHRASLSRKWFDGTMRLAMQHLGESGAKTRTVYWAVRLFGGRNYKPSPPTPASVPHA